MRTITTYLVRAIALCAVIMTASVAYAQNNSVEDKGYILNTGDTIQIDVYREEDLSTQVLLNKAGQFSYPYLGIISASGKTAEELAAELEQGLKGDYLIYPEVNISILEYRNYYVGGEVRTPGGYPYQPGLTVKQAIVIAGGETEWASSSRYRIQRENSSEYIKANEKTVVLPGDTVTIEAGLF